MSEIKRADGVYRGLTTRAMNCGYNYFGRDFTREDVRSADPYRLHLTKNMGRVALRSLLEWAGCDWPPPHLVKTPDPRDAQIRRLRGLLRSADNWLRMEGGSCPECLALSGFDCAPDCALAKELEAE